MASIFDGWTGGNLNGPFQPSGVADWSAFYRDTVDPFAVVKRQYNATTPKAWGVSIPEIGGAKTNTLSDGTVVQSEGAAVDFLNRVLGVSPLAGDHYKNQETGETVSPGTGAPAFIEGFGGIVSRATIIILGFIFVAVGLSMFKGAPVVTIANAVK